MRRTTFLKGDPADEGDRHTQPVCSLPHLGPNTGFSTGSKFPGAPMCGTQDMVKCRVCGSPNITLTGIAGYYSDLVLPVYDCRHCLCRFTQHDERTYDTLHADSDSYYASYRDLADTCKQLFEHRDVQALKAELSQASKYKFVIEEVERGGAGQKILEVGCSRGYLASYFLLTGHDLIAADVSPTAIEAARAAFGGTFVLTDSRLIPERAPYDLIYHVGTIGCVGDPIGLTRRMLAMLKPGGALLFNAPNRDSLWFRGQLWIDSAPPPDLVTLFPPGFWAKEFAEVACVEEHVEMCPADRGVTIGVGKLLRRQWKPPAPVPLGYFRLSATQGGGIGERLLLLMEGGARKTGRVTGLSRFAPKQPYEFGLLVKMIRK
ncbi:MAG TPA: class I SAM-dependent methyltransferase [Blastocatellia bacterium]